MSRSRRRASSSLLLWVVLLIVLGAGGVVVGVKVVHQTTTTTTTIAPERPQAGWQVASTSARGVLVDFKMETVLGHRFRVFRLRARTTLLRWHVGTIDPLNAHAPNVPRDASPSISPTEYEAGVLAAFNGGFKQAAKAGGSVVDGVTLQPLVKGKATIVIDRFGHWEMGVWGTSSFPTTGFEPIAVRQNLTLLVDHGAITPLATTPRWMLWGDPWKGAPAQPRTGLGVDAQGNLIFVGTMEPVMPVTVAHALLAAGAVTGMQLDMNPYWPVAGASFGVLHDAHGHFGVVMPNSEHPTSVFFDGWQRDFFVALAAPGSWHCSWVAPGVDPALTGAQPQPLSLRGRHCLVPVTSSPVSTTSTTLPPG